MRRDWLVCLLRTGCGLGAWPYTPHRDLTREKHKAQTSALPPCAPCLVWWQHEGIGWHACVHLAVTRAPSALPPATTGSTGSRMHHIWRLRPGSSRRQDTLLLPGVHHLLRHHLLEHHLLRHHLLEHHLLRRHLLRHHPVYSHVRLPIRTWICFATMLWTMLWRATVGHWCTLGARRQRCRTPPAISHGRLTSGRCNNKLLLHRHKQQAMGTNNKLWAQTTSYGHK